MSSVHPLFSDDKGDAAAIALLIGVTIGVSQACVD